MKKELIVTAKSVEEARKKAAAELGIREEDMMVTVLEEGKRGFLGIGASEAKIRFPSRRTPLGSFHCNSPR